MKISYAKSQDPTLWQMILVFFIAFGFFASIWIGSSHMEAKAYNRITGSDVTTGEAMWVELRVDGCQGNR